MRRRQKAINCVICVKKIYHQYGLGHVVLIASYTLFLLCFAGAFYLAENYQSSAYYQQWQNQLAYNCQKFIKTEILPNIFNNSKLLLFIHDHKTQYMSKLLQEKLTGYERKLRLKPPMPVLKCTFTNAMLYAFSSVTTIGYSFIYPITKAGRITSIAFSTMGIPFTIIVIKDIEYLLVKILSYPCVFFVQLWHIFRFCTLSTVSESETEEKLDHSQLKYNKSNYRISTAERLLLMPIMVAVMALVGWISIGCLLCHFYNPYVESHLLVYFVFNSLSTIGLGGIDIGEHPLVFIVLFAFILCGLAIISAFINLMHTKFSRQYWLPGNVYMPMLPRNRIYAANPATIDSFDEDGNSYANEPLIYRTTTLGIFQAEDRCPTLQEIRKKEAISDATTQTIISHHPHYERVQSPVGGLPNIPKVNAAESYDDVNSLIVETYTGKPARLITTSSNFKKGKANL